MEEEEVLRMQCLIFMPPSPIGVKVVTKIVINYTGNPIPIPGIKLMKLEIKLLALFCKLDHFLIMSNACCIAMKRSSLQHRVSKKVL
jgi:hypothetical protein